MSAAVVSAGSQPPVPAAEELPVAPLENRRPAAPHRRALLTLAVCAAALTLAITLWIATRAQAAELALRQSRAVQVAADAGAIAQLRGRPRQATEVGLKREDLLERVNRATQAAGLPPEKLISTDPQPARRVPGSDHAEVTCRLVFEGVALEHLVHFCYALTSANPELRVAAIQLRSGQDSSRWNADVSLAYWILAPDSSH
jgi:hypothetical protein